MLDWFTDHPAVLWSVTGVSAALMLAAIIATPICLVRLPKDYFANHEKYEKKRSKSLPLKIAKNIAGVLLILVGLAMLLLPGQGLITVVLGVMITDIPGKQRLIAWIFSRKGVLKGVNWLRKKFHEPPMDAPQRGAPKGGSGEANPIPAKGHAQAPSVS